MRVLFLKRDHDISSWLIRTWTRSPYVHTELEFSTGIRFTSLAGAGTTFLSLLTSEEEKNWESVDVPMTPEQERDVRIFCESEVGCSYDWAAIFYTQIFGLGREHPKAWFCSEICAAALAVVGKPWPNRRFCKISPKRLHSLMASLRLT